MDSRNLRVKAAIAIVCTLALVGLGTVATAESDDSSVRVEIQQGILACAAGTSLIATDNVCIAAVLGPDHSELAFEIPAGADFSYVEMQWQNTNALGGKKLALTAPDFYVGDATHRVEASSVLDTFVQSIDEQGAPPGTTIHLRVGAAHDLGVVLQQRFTVAVSSFSNMDLPAGYSAFA